MRDQENEVLREALLETVENQLRDNDPPETRMTLERLQAEGFSEEDAKIHIARAVAIEIWNVLRNQKESDPERYIGNLRRLPEEPVE